MPDLPLATFYEAVLGLHILAVVVTFGVTFAYPVVLSYGRRLDPAHMGWFHRMQARIGGVLIQPGLAVVLAAGIYLASDSHQWGQFYVQWGLAAVLVLGALGGLFFTPRERRLAELADRDVAASRATGAAQVTLSADYDALSRQVGMVGGLSSLLVAVTVFLMALHA